MRWLYGITNSMDMSLGDDTTLGISGGQGGLVCCSPWGRKESDTTERLNKGLKCTGWRREGLKGERLLLDKKTATQDGLLG